MSSQRIFITGGASGLGHALALRYARAGWRVAIGDVNNQAGAAVHAELAALAPEALYLRCDVTQETDRIQAAEQLQARWGGVDVVVNNAGVAQAGAIDDVPLSDWQWILDINLLGVVRGCKVFTPLFKRQGHGHFVNIASMAGLLDMPLMSSYNVSKAGVVALSETLQHELADANIAVTVVCPSFFKTNLTDSMRATDVRLRAMVNRLFEKAELQADDIAEAVFTGVARKQFHVLPHAEGRRAWWLKRHLPRPAYVWLMERTTRRMRQAPSRTH